MRGIQEDYEFALLAHIGPAEEAAKRESRALKIGFRAKFDSAPAKHL